MSGLSTNYTAAALLTILLAAALVVLLYFGYRAWKSSQITAQERERRRCAQLVALGKISDATLVEVRGSLLFYSYDVRGVEYTASQDLAWLVGEVTPEFAGISAMGVKYDPRNPANSIVLAPDWSGLRGAARALPQDHANRE